MSHESTQISIFIKLHGKQNPPGVSDDFFKVETFIIDFL